MTEMKDDLLNWALLQGSSLGCKDTSNVVNVTLAPLPNVTVPQSTFTACFTGGPTVVPAGIPTGGVWSGLGMVNDSVFDPTVLGPGPSFMAVPSWEVSAQYCAPVLTKHEVFWPGGVQQQRPLAK